jgi:hypothetical protein
MLASGPKWSAPQSGILLETVLLFLFLVVAGCVLVGKVAIVLRFHIASLIFFNVVAT